MSDRRERGGKIAPIEGSDGGAIGVAKHLLNLRAGPRAVQVGGATVIMRSMGHKRMALIKGGWMRVLDMPVDPYHTAPDPLPDGGTVFAFGVDNCLYAAAPGGSGSEVYEKYNSYEKYYWDQAGIEYVEGTTYYFRESMIGMPPGSPSYTKGSGWFPTGTSLEYKSYWTAVGTLRSYAFCLFLGPYKDYYGDTYYFTEAHSGTYYPSVCQSTVTYTPSTTSGEVDVSYDPGTVVDVPTPDGDNYLASPKPDWYDASRGPWNSHKAYQRAIKTTSEEVARYWYDYDLAVAQGWAAEQDALIESNYYGSMTTRPDPTGDKKYVYVGTIEDSISNPTKITQYKYNEGDEYPGLALVMYRKMNLYEFDPVTITKNAKYGAWGYYESYPWPAYYELYWYHGYAPGSLDPTFYKSKRKQALGVVAASPTATKGTEGYTDEYGVFHKGDPQTGPLYALAVVTDVTGPYDTEKKYEFTPRETWFLKGPK